MALTKVKSGMRTLATDEVTATEIAAGAVAASEIASTFDISSKTVTLPAASVTAHVTAFDDSVLSNNVALLAFKLAAGDSLTKFNMVDSVIDDFADSSGIDTANSINESLTSGVYSAETAATVTPKFGSSSIKFDGAGDWIAVAHSSDFALGTINWTIEAWVYLTANQGNTYNAIINNYIDTGGPAGWSFLLTDATGNPRLHTNHGTPNGSMVVENSTSTVTQGQWVHVVHMRSGNTGYHFFDGALDSGGSFAENVNDANQNGTDGLTIGASKPEYNNRFLVGHLDDIRISNNSRYSTSGFTPPSRLSNDANTLLLVQSINQANGSTTFTDASSSNRTLTANGDVQHSGAEVGDLTLISNTTTAENTATTADLVFLMEDAAGTNTLGTHVKAYVSRNGNANWSNALTLVDEGDWGTNKRIVTARNVDISGLGGTTAMRWKITTHSQTSALQAKIHAVSLGWS